jgi:hypothetical protein
MICLSGNSWQKCLLYFYRSGRRTAQKKRESSTILIHLRSQKTRTLLLPLYQFHWGCVGLSSNHEVIDDSEYHSSSKHDYVPIHRAWCDRNRDREEHKDPNHKQKQYCTNVDKDTKAAEGPATWWKRFPVDTSDDKAGKGDNIGSK